MRAIIASIVAAVLLGPSARTSRHGMTQAGVFQMRYPSAADQQEHLAQIEDRIGRGTDPAAEAVAAARAGEFGLITMGQFSVHPPGVTCFTPYGQAPSVLAHLAHGDVITESISQFSAYANAYNRAMVDQANYPAADLCRVQNKADQPSPRDLFAIATPARTVSTPPATLHEAARRGSAGDLKRLLGTQDVDALDSMGMTPLAWAVARNNGMAIDLLVNADANPWIGASNQFSAVFVAARLGRQVAFARLESLSGRPFTVWPASYLSAAVAGANTAIIAQLLADPHESLRLELLGSPFPSAAAIEPVLTNDPKLADALLWYATNYPSDRADLVRLALRHGANPNAPDPGRYGTILGAFANGISPTSVEIVDMLLKAGADPNQMSHRSRPIQLAIKSLKLPGMDPARPLAILHRLKTAGADINLGDDQNIPPAWDLLFPLRYDRDTMDASFVTPALLELLVKSGLDLNAEREGKRILPYVERQAGKNSELAVTLRRLGALS